MFSINFDRFAAREPAQTTSQGPNIAPKKFQGHLEFLFFFDFFLTKMFRFFRHVIRYFRYQNQGFRARDLFPDLRVAISLRIGLIFSL